jgi:hypothetical protein
MGFLDIVGLRYNPCIAYVNILNGERYNSSMWALPKSVLVYGCMMQILYVMYIGKISILYHDMGIVMGIPSQNIDLKRIMYVLHFGFMFNDECLYNYKFFRCKNLTYFLESWEGFQSLIPFMSKTPPNHL